MSKLYDFIVEHAKFPFPHPDGLQSVDITDISEFEVGLLKRDWKPKHAVQDDTLVQKLCHTLEEILGDTLFPEDAEHYLLSSLGPKLQVDERGSEDWSWFKNPNEAHSRSLFDKGFYTAAHHSVEGGSSKVDYVILVDSEPNALCELKSPSVIAKAGEMLPPHGIELKWFRGQSLMPKILAEAALYLGLRQMEWLFLTCHNYWIVCHLVRDDDDPFLVYSPKISVEDSSEPFRAFLGTILSVTKGVPVESSIFDPRMQFDAMTEEDKDPLPEDESDSHEKPGLMITSSSPKSPESFQVWIHLHTMSNNTFALPQCVGKRKPRLLLTRFVGYGSTGNVWKCRFDNCDDSESFAVKIVETLRCSDADSRQRLRNEFKVYRILERAHQSGKLRDRIVPHCYGAFESEGADALILDFCDNTLKEWDELTASERDQVFKLVQDLHGVGILHGDLEPRNIVRARGGGFRLIDFTESRKHTCKEFTATVQVDELHTPPAPVQNRKCSELEILRNYLWK